MVPSIERAVKQPESTITTLILNLLVVEMNVEVFYCAWNSLPYDSERNQLPSPSQAVPSSDYIRTTR